MVKSPGGTSPINRLKDENNYLISDNYEKAWLLHNYFCSICTLNDSKTSSPDFLIRTNAPTDFSLQITPSKVLDILQIKTGLYSSSHQMH